MPKRVEIERRGALVIRRTYDDVPNEVGVVAERLISEDGWDYGLDILAAIKKRLALLDELKKLL